MGRPANRRWDRDLSLTFKYPGVELHGFPKMAQKVRGAVISWIEMKLMFYAFGVQLPIESRRPFFETVFIIIATIEINR